MRGLTVNPLAFVALVPLGGRMAPMVAANCSQLHGCPVPSTAWIAGPSSWDTTKGDRKRGAADWIVPRSGSKPCPRANTDAGTPCSWGDRAWKEGVRSIARTASNSVRPGDPLSTMSGIGRAGSSTT